MIIKNYSLVFPKNYLEDFQKTKENLSKSLGGVIDKVLSDTSIGIKVGASFWVANHCINSCISGFLEKSQPVNLERMNKYIDFIMRNPKAVIVKGPVLEELVFRGLLQPVLTKGVAFIYGDKEIEVFNHKIKIAEAVGVTASSVLFGMAHLTNGTGVQQVISTTLTGLVLGTLKNRYGLLSATSAHMTNNAIGWGLLAMIHQ